MLIKYISLKDLVLRHFGERRLKITDECAERINKFLQLFLRITASVHCRSNQCFSNIIETIIQGVNVRTCDQFIKCSINSFTKINGSDIRLLENEIANIHDIVKSVMGYSSMKYYRYGFEKWIKYILYHITNYKHDTVYNHEMLSDISCNNPVISKIATVFSIHNLFFQATYDHRYVSEMDYDDGHSEIPGFYNERINKINWMRRGIMYADMINTVSPNYAKEIVTADYGELLDGLLRERRNVLVGILNGIDYTIWNPKNDPSIKKISKKKEYGTC